MSSKCCKASTNKERKKRKVQTKNDFFCIYNDWLLMRLTLSYPLHVLSVLLTVLHKDGLYRDGRSETL